MGEEGGQSEMDNWLLNAATYGSQDWEALGHLISRDPTVLRGITPQGNNCFHICSIHGVKTFCELVLGESEIFGVRQSGLVRGCQSHNEYLLSQVNSEGETPLLTAITRGHVSLALLLLDHYRHLKLHEAILQQDRYGFNALHHAIRSGHEHLALWLIEIQPDLSKAVTNYNESPMFIAVMRNFAEVFSKLLYIPGSSHSGQYGRHALHAAARNGNQGIAHEILRTRPQLATKADSAEVTPIRMAVSYNKVDVLRVLLEYDRSLGHEIDNHGYPLMWSAAERGQVDAARLLLSYCPNVPFSPTNGKKSTCLHIAVQNGHPEFVKFIISTNLAMLVNIQDEEGKTALHYAIHQCNPRLVAVLLSHDGIDTTILDNHGCSAASPLSAIAQDEMTLDWKEVHVLMLKADPKDDDLSSYNLRKRAKQQESIESRRHRKSLTQKYTSNTSLVAILLATITFTAAFTLPGGYSSDPGIAGLPIMSRKIAFQAFLVSDTLAMCSSFVVAFICLMGKWEDDKFTSYYISVTKKLTWFAYMATITAFSTGLYTVLASHLHWLAIGICSLVAILPFLTMFIGKWPVLRLQIRLSETWANLKIKFQPLRQTWYSLGVKCGFHQSYNTNSSDMV